MMDWRTRLAGRSARFWLLVAAAAVGVAVALWWAFIRPGQIADQAAETMANATIAAAAPTIARETLKEVERFNETRIEIRDRVVAGNQAIASAHGAGAAIPDPVHRAGLAALCMHPVYRDDPGCAAVPELRAGPVVDKDTGRRPAG